MLTQYASVYTSYNELSRVHEAVNYSNNRGDRLKVNNVARCKLWNTSFPDIKSWDSILHCEQSVVLNVA